MATKQLTLRELQLQIRDTLLDKFALPIWISAEISDLKVNYSGHCYLELIEKGESDGVAVAQARAVIWRSNYLKLSSYFEAEAGQPLSKGLKVLVKVLVTHHELYGLSLQITDIDPSYTIGDMERQRMLTIAQLQKDGVWDLNREIKFDTLIQRIAIISSANAAGYQDFCREVERSGYLFNLTLFDSFMQGSAAEESIIAALENVAYRMEEFDAVVIIRGGGSVSDLGCFNSYRLCSHVAQFPLPIVSGIGHDKDISVVDMVAKKSLKTPTAVATWLVERMQQIEGWLDDAAIKLHDSAVNIIREHQLIIERSQNELISKSEQIIEQQKLGLYNRLTILPERVEQLLTLEQTKLQGAEASIESHSPQHLLKLGFAVARTGGRALNSTEGVNIDDLITIELANGEIVTQVKSVKK